MPLSQAKALLLAAHFAAQADMTSFAGLASSHHDILHDELLLRLLLTYLPEILNPSKYVGFLVALVNAQLRDDFRCDIDSSAVKSLSNNDAKMKARRLRLVSLSCSDVHPEIENNAFSRFLVIRARLMHSKAGLLGQLLDLLLPFTHQNVGILEWTACTVIPFVRRNLLRDAHSPEQETLHDFERLSDRQASGYLLHYYLTTPASWQSDPSYSLSHIIGPWVYDSRRWNDFQGEGTFQSSALVCSGWQSTLQSLLLFSRSSWKAVFRVFEAWDGPQDIQFGYGITMQLPQQHQDHLRQTYTRTVLACIYTVQESSLDYLGTMFVVLAKLRSHLSRGKSTLSLEHALSDLPDLSLASTIAVRDDRIIRFMRHDLLRKDNPLTDPNDESISTLLGLALSAYLLTFYGFPCSLRKLGEMKFLCDLQDQRFTVTKLLHAMSAHVAEADDKHVLRLRERIFWLRNWSNNKVPTQNAGIFGLVDSLFIETEFLKTLLSSGRHELARTLYSNGPHELLSTVVVHDVVFQTALSAFDNDPYPKGNGNGLRKCSQLIQLLEPSSSDFRRMQALLKATYALSGYTLRLKQGEPFSPVVLRIHSDPISIIGTVLQQNPRAYTRLSEFLEIGMNMIKARPPLRGNGTVSPSVAADSFEADMKNTEKRITAMCILAALEEDDFETAYSYVASRLGVMSQSLTMSDKWSWEAAMRAGQYIRTARSQQPTHFGTATSNLEIRHLEQRMDCLATALRIAPTNQLQEILKSFRRCEEQLDSAVKDEAANEVAWDTMLETRDLPGSFLHSTTNGQREARHSTKAAGRLTEDAPMSLFDLSRATARAAQKNFTALSSLRSISGNIKTSGQANIEEPRQNARRRDQLREAATGTLVSGVGWLIGAHNHSDST